MSVSVLASNSDGVSEEKGSLEIVHQFSAFLDRWNSNEVWVTVETVVVFFFCHWQWEISPVLYSGGCQVFGVCGIPSGMDVEGAGLQVGLADLSVWHRKASLTYSPPVWNLFLFTLQASERSDVHLWQARGKCEKTVLISVPEFHTLHALTFHLLFSASPSFRMSTPLFSMIIDCTCTIMGSCVGQYTYLDLRCALSMPNWIKLQHASEVFTSRPHWDFAHLHVFFNCLRLVLEKDI